MEMGGKLSAPVYATKAHNGMCTTGLRIIYGPKGLTPNWPRHDNEQQFIFFLHKWNDRAIIVPPYKTRYEMKTYSKRQHSPPCTHMKRCLSYPLKVDAGMARLGYELAWHGTVGYWNTPRFTAPHGISAFYLSVERGAAESYAALRSLDSSEKPRVMKFYVSLRNVLIIRNDGGGAKKFEATLATAKARGYDAVKVIGALDDQYYRIDRHGTIISPTGEKALGEAGPTDIWVVLNPASVVSARNARRLLSNNNKRRGKKAS